jgi:hypothetical protein
MAVPQSITPSSFSLAQFFSFSISPCHRQLTSPYRTSSTCKDRRLLDCYCPITLVTKASTGIGRAITTAFDLVLIACCADALGELAGKQRGQSGARVQVLPADIDRIKKVALVLNMGDVNGQVAIVYRRCLVGHAEVECQDRRRWTVDLQRH